jgi:DNA transformation protein and related proteins
VVSFSKLFVAIVEHMMPVRNKEQEFISYVVDMMQSIGPVYSKKMFGGHGIFLEGMMFALVADSTLYFKVDKDSADYFIAQGLEAFSYSKNGKVVKMSYYQAPEEALEDSEVMNEWGNRAYAAALRVASNNK